MITNLPSHHAVTMLVVVMASAVFSSALLHLVFSNQGRRAANMANLATILILLVAIVFAFLIVGGNLGS